LLAASEDASWAKAAGANANEAARARLRLRKDNIGNLLVIFGKPGERADVG